ncbi:MAG: hypothetical protein J1F02_07605 [Lachnospiraceae bacterium]|nr:hypothetical protein [Lachnospiraceae bacterium]
MKNNKQELEQFKSGIFSLGTNFGELAQLMIEKLEKFKPADEKYFDLLDSNKKRIEVKFSRARKKLKSLRSSNIIDLCMNAATDSWVLTEDEATKVSFDCNIQQIKHLEFDILYYGIFFQDKIVIFKAKSKAVLEMPGYSIQHKGGKEYQFHINRTTYAHHKENHFYKEISYPELFELFKKK